MKTLLNISFNYWLLIELLAFHNKLADGAGALKIYVDSQDTLEFENCARDRCLSRLHRLVGDGKRVIAA